MRVDVFDISGVQLCILQGNLHCLACAATLIVRCRNMRGIAGDPKAHQLRIDACAACFGMLKFFHDNDARAFSQHESIAVTVEWSTGSGWIIVARTERLHCRETANAERGDCAFAATSHHHIRVAALNDVECCADRVASSSACSRSGDVCALQAKSNADISSQCIDHELRHNERAD